MTNIGRGPTIPRLQDGEGQCSGRENDSCDDYENPEAGRQHAEALDDIAYRTGGRSYESGFENDVRYGNEEIRHFGGGNNYGDGWKEEDYGRPHGWQRAQEKPDAGPSTTTEVATKHERGSQSTAQAE